MASFLPKRYIFAGAVAGVTGTGYVIRNYFLNEEYEGKQMLNDKVAIVTGANSGIGKETARALAARGAKIIMACRNKEECEKVRREIVLSTKNKYIYCRDCDLASQESIRQFVKRFKLEHSELHLLINNGGVMRCKQDFTHEGIELQLGVNHMGHFLLTNLLLDVLKKSAPSRIINLASAAHAHGKINVEDLNSSKDYHPTKAYNQSKLANVLFTKELANRLKDSGVTVLAVHPGLVNTNITRHLHGFTGIYARYITRPFMSLFTKSAKQGAQSVLYAALDPSLKFASGTYISKLKPVEASEDANNEKLAKWLWTVSEKWTKLNVS